MAAATADNTLRSLGYGYVPGPGASQSDWVLSPRFAWKGQENYDAVAAACTAWVKAQLAPRFGLAPVKLGEATAYATPHLSSWSGPVLLLICGSAPGGDCGVWGRALCINDSTLSGSMFETISRAKERGWAVVVADPHGCGANDSPHKHLLTLWKNIPGAPLLVIGHSYGAAMAVGMLKAAEAEFGAQAVAQKMRALALTDGMVWAPATGWRGGAAVAHEGLSVNATDAELDEAAGDDAAKRKALAARRAELRKWQAVLPSFEPPSDALLQLLVSVGRDWVASERPLGTRVAVEGQRLIPSVSAGVTSHPATTHAALDDVFAFLDRAASRRKRTRE